MKKILFLFGFLVLCVITNAQNIPSDSAKYSRYPYTYGIWYPKIIADKVMIAPMDTVYSKNGFAFKGLTLYIGDGTKWTATTGGGGGTVSITPGYGVATSPNPITGTGSVRVDSAALSAYYQRIKDSLLKYVTPSQLRDSITALITYLNTGLENGAPSLPDTIFIKINDSLYRFLTPVHGFGTLLSHTDTTFKFSVDTSLVATLVRLLSDSSALKAFIDLKLNISDTASHWVNNITNNASNDSIVFFIGSTRYAIKDNGSGNVNASISTVKNIVYITQPTSGSSLAAGWQTFGTPTYSVANGAFTFTSGSNVYTKGIETTVGVGSETSTLTGYVIPVTIGATDQGAAIGYNAYGASGNGVMVRYVTGTGDAHRGYIAIYSAGSSNTVYSVDSNTNVSAGDSLLYKIVRTRFNYKVTVKNITKNWIIGFDYNHTETISPSFVTGASSYVAAFVSAGSYTVAKMRYTINVPAIVKLIVVGNSITSGDITGGEYFRYASNIGYPSQTLIMGGGGDVIGDVQLRFGEIAAIADATGAESVLLEIGGNDVQYNSGTLTTTMKNHYIELRDSCNAHSMNVVHILPPPRSGTNLTTFKDFIDTSATFKSDKIVRGTWYNLLGSGTSLAALYDGGDGVHPNNLGMALMASTINQALHYPNANNFAINGNAIANNGYLAGRDLGLVTVGAGKSGGLYVFNNNPSNEYYVNIGMRNNGTTDYGYINGFVEGVGARPIVLNSYSATNNGTGTTNPIAGWDVNVNAVGNKVGYRLHNAQLPAVGDENQFDFAVNATTVARISQTRNSVGWYGLNFYGYNSGLQSTPTIQVGGDLTTVFGGAISTNYVAKTSTYTATVADNTIDCTGTFTLSLPTASGITGRIYNIKNSGTGTLTIDPSGSETIDGSTTLVSVIQYSTYTIKSDGTNWIIINN